MTSGVGGQRLEERGKRSRVSSEVGDGDTIS